MFALSKYAPTCKYSEEETEGFYGDDAKAKQQYRPHDMVLKLGVQMQKFKRITWGDCWTIRRGERNERGDMWVEYCVESELLILNTWFRHHPRKLWT